MKAYRAQRFPMGLVFFKNGRRYSVVDVERTYNSASEMVALRYITQHTICGQGVRSTMVDTEIARALDALAFESYKDKDFTPKTIRVRFKKEEILTRKGDTND